MVDAFLGWCARDERTAATAAAQPGHAQPPTSCDGRWSERRRFHRRSLPEPGRVKTKPDVASQRGLRGGLAEADRSFGQPEACSLALRGGLRRASRPKAEPARLLTAWGSLSWCSLRAGSALQLGLGLGFRQRGGPPRSPRRGGCPCPSPLPSCSACARRTACRSTR